VYLSAEEKYSYEATSTCVEKGGMLITWQTFKHNARMDHIAKLV
jgi:hypothetical protein